jgi:hypothetical protein
MQADLCLHGKKTVRNILESTEGKWTRNFVVYAARFVLLGNSNGRIYVAGH